MLLADLAKRSLLRGGGRLGAAGSGAQHMPSADRGEAGSFSSLHKRVETQKVKSSETAIGMGFWSGLGTGCGGFFLLTWVVGISS